MIASLTASACQQLYLTARIWATPDLQQGANERACCTNRAVIPLSR